MSIWYTTDRQFQVFIPSSYNDVSGGSQLNGCTPVRRMSRGSRGTCSSGVPLSISKMFVGLTEGGGRGKLGSSGVGRLCHFTCVFLEVKLSISIAVWVMVAIAVVCRQAVATIR